MGRAALIASAVLLLFASGASAAGTVSTPGGGAPVLVEDSPGNGLSLELRYLTGENAGVLFGEITSKDLSAGAGCRQARPFEVLCDQPAGTPVELRLGDARDFLQAQAYRWPLTIDGGSGDDLLLSGRGRDKIDGGDGADNIDARDQLFGARNIGYFKKPVRDVVACGAGRDSVSVDALDRVASDCEDVTMFGTTGPDRLKGDARDEVFVAHGGDDLIIGGGGRDEIRAEGGDDRIDARDGRQDTILCGPGRDRVRADRGDRVTDCEQVIRSRPR